MSYRLKHGSKTMATARPAARTATRLRDTIRPPRVLSPPQPANMGTAANVADLATALEILTHPAGGLTAKVLETFGQFGWWWPNRDADANRPERMTEQDGLVIDMGAAVDTPEDTTAQAPPSITRYLQAATTADVKRARAMSSICAMAYNMANLTPRRLWHCHRVHLVTTSTAWAKPTEEAEQAEDAVLLGDGMASTTPEDPMMSKTVVDNNSNNIVAIEEALRQMPALDKKPQKGPWNGTTRAMAEATMFAASSVSSAAGSLYQQAMTQLAKQAVYGASAEHVKVAVSRLLSILYATLTFKGMLGNAVPVLALPSDDTSTSTSGSDDVGQCPFQWYVADDPKHKLRIFVIQGSVRVESWQVNLTFDPAVFEDESLGVRVHRGAYETAQQLYGLFEPLVKDHLESSPDAKITFTGHSLGGSLATLLALMFVHRGVIPPHSISPVFSFGAAAVFCEGAVECTDCQTCAFASSCEGKTSEKKVTRGLLEHLGIPSSAIRNVIMHRDIVPKSFACDYSPVVPLLRRVGTSFREHGCLGDCRALMYNFLGSVLVLQPCESQKFVKGEGYHPMFPEGPGLFHISDPKSGSKGCGCCSAMSTATTEDGIPIEAASQKDAVLSFMDFPHPLEILGDPGAYGDTGTISRYHNPHNYTRALKSVFINSKSTELGELVKTVASQNSGSRGAQASMERKLGSHKFYSWKMRSTSYEWSRTRCRRSVQKTTMDPTQMNSSHSVD